MALLIGVSLALAVGIFASLVGFDRDRGFYSAVLAVVASFYALFAVLGGSTEALLLECVVIVAFLAAAALGFRVSPWILVAGLAAHGVFDLFHGHVIANPGVPAWWSMFCMGYDVTAAAYLAWVLVRRAKTQPA